jgi:hypothetical protein
MLVRTDARTPQQVAKVDIRGLPRRDTHWGLSMAQRPRFVFVGVHHTRVPDAAYPWDPEIVRAIRVFDPGFVPIFRRILLRDTHSGAIREFCHHGIGRFSTRRPVQPWVARIPTPSCGYGRDFGPITMVDRWIQGPVVVGSPRQRYSLPPPFVPYSDWVYQWARRNYWEASAREMRNYQREIDRRRPERLARKTEEAEAEYRVKQESPYQKRLLEQLSPDDAREYLARRSGAYREDPKPFVHLRSA